MYSLFFGFDFDVFGVSEMWLNPGTLLASLCLGIRCYTVTNSNIIEEDGDRGVVIIIKDGIQFEHHNIEDLWTLA